MYKFVALVAAIAVIPVSCASAADMALKAPPAPAYSAPGYNWTGFYLGGNFGGGWGNENYSLTGTNALGTLVGGGSADPSGVFGGGQIGVNYEFP